MIRIFKYTLDIVDEQTLNLPTGSKIVSVIEQNNDVVLYALVDDEEKHTNGHVIRIVGTGHPFPDCGEHFFVGTVSNHAGSRVWHVFEHVSLSIPLSNIRIEYNLTARQRVGVEQHGI